MTPDVVAAYGLAIAALVAAVIGALIKPLIEALPFANPAKPAAYNGAAHDALLRASNVALNVAGVLIMGLATGQVSLANWLPVTLQIAAQAIGSHALYQAVKPSTPAAIPVVVSNAAVASALNTAISQSQQSTASASAGQPNAVKRLADDAQPALQPVTATLPIVKPAGQTAHA